jgi:hypothetical protein
MSSTMTLREANRIVEERSKLLAATLNPTSVVMLNLINRREAYNVKNLSARLNISILRSKQILGELEALGLVTRSGETFEVTGDAKTRINYGAVSLDFLVNSTIKAEASHVPHALSGTYAIREMIGQGATSVTFRAEQAGTHRDRTLKVFLPGAVEFDELDLALKKRSLIRSDAALPEIIDAGQVVLRWATGEETVVPCVVLRYVNSHAKTFSAFLKAQENLNATLFDRFIDRVGGALAAIEAVGLAHGDLHEGNILVVPGDAPSVAHEFWVIDFIGVPSATSPELEILTDIENFRNHLIRAAVIACERYPGYSARRLLGESSFRVLEGLRENKYQSFREMLQDFRRPKIEIPKNYFQTPAPEPFEWLRVEWIPSPEWLYKLFESDPSRFETISRFGNTWISGPRGCGKSHYLRVLAFYPEVIICANADEELAAKLTELGYDFRKAFGVLFACRLGEFKSFVPEAMGKQRFDPATKKFLKHVVVLKIWTKTLQILREGLDSVDPSTGRPVLQVPPDVRQFIEFLEDRLGSIAVVSDTNPMSIFLQCLAACTARENSATAVWFDPRCRSNVRLLDESDLDKFFAILKRTFPDLSVARFFILVDDASFGNIDFEMQKIINSLVRAAQANHCFKITCDKFMYTLDTAEGRSIDPRHEVTYVDLGEVSTKAQRETAVDLSGYMARVINRRLKARGYQSNIQGILGRSQDVREFLSALSIPGARRPKRNETPKPKPARPQAYYAGWNIVWSITHGSVRTLLELVEHIFKTNRATQDTTNISLKNQDTAVRSYANRQFKALTMLPGELDGEPLGRALQAVMSAIGEMSRQYLQHYHTGDERRWYETISLERLDRSKLSPKAQKILEELVKYGLLLDEGITFSRAQFGLCQRYDMNKIFAPAFETTYRVRNHIYLRWQRFEELLLKPDVFVKRHRDKLRDLAQRSGGEQPQATLF